MFSTYSKLGRVLCVYEDESKNVRTGWGKVVNKKIEIFGKRFDVLPQCIQTTRINTGIHKILPMQVSYLHLVWYSRYPINPNDYKRSWDSPELRNMLNLEEILQSFFKNYKPKDPKAKKAIGGFSQYLPYIFILIVFIVIMFWVNGQFNGMKNVINEIELQLSHIPK